MVLRTLSFMVLATAFAISVALALYSAAERSAWFHIAVISSGSVLLTGMFLSGIRGNVKSGAALALSAGVVVYILLKYASQTGDSGSATAALLFGVLCTGLCALLLLSRSDVKLTTTARAAVMIAVLALCLSGPMMHVLGLTEGTVGDVTELMVMFSLPMIPLVLGTFLVLSARHRSEVTVPSDKWV